MGGLFFRARNFHFWGGRFVSGLAFAAPPIIRTIHYVFIGFVGGETVNFPFEYQPRRFIFDKSEISRKRNPREGEKRRAVERTRSPWFVRCSAKVFHSITVIFLTLSKVFRFITSAGVCRDKWMWEKRPSCEIWKCFFASEKNYRYRNGSGSHSSREDRS